MLKPFSNILSIFNFHVKCCVAAIFKIARYANAIIFVVNINSQKATKKGSQITRRHFVLWKTTNELSMYCLDN